MTNDLVEFAFKKAFKNDVLKKSICEIAITETFNYDHDPKREIIYQNKIFDLNYIKRLRVTCHDKGKTFHLIIFYRARLKKRAQILKCTKKY